MPRNGGGGGRKVYPQLLTSPGLCQPVFRTTFITCRRCVCVCPATEVVSAPSPPSVRQVNGDGCGCVGAGGWQQPSTTSDVQQNGVEVTGSVRAYRYFRPAWPANPWPYRTSRAAVRSAAHECTHACVQRACAKRTVRMAHMSPGAADKCRHACVCLCARRIH